MSPQAMDIEGSLGDTELIKAGLGLDDDGRPARTGNQWTALAHVITAVSGAGVLSLAWSISQIGWVAGPIVILVLALATLYASFLLTDCYRNDNKTRNNTYSKCVLNILGERQAWISALAQYVDLYGATVAYTIVSSSSMASIVQSVCFRKYGIGHEACENMNTGRYMLIFGGLEIFLSQLEDMHRVWWLSAVATLMSFSYSFILLVLSATKVSGHGHSHGTAFGVPVGPRYMRGTVTPYQKTLDALQAIGNMSYSFLFTSVLIEIQDTLKSSPPENKVMKKAISIGVLYTTIFYMALGGIGYAAYGDETPGNLLKALVSYQNVFWLVDLANLFVIIQILGAYQVNAQPIFGFIEGKAMEYFRQNNVIKEEKISHIVLFQKKFTISHGAIFRVTWRIAFVVVTTLISIALPFFNAILGLLGAMAYWPLTIYFPVRMHMTKFNVKRWSPKWIGLQVFVIVFLLVSCSGIAGSIQEILQAVKSHQAFRI